MAMEYKIPFLEPGPEIVRLVDIEPNPDNPRKNFNPEALEQLAASIRAVGILQPLVVTQIPTESNQFPRYRIVCGERRWRAAKLAGLTSVPVIVKDLADYEIQAVMLIENLQREDLDPIEEARALRVLVDHGWKQIDLAERLGVSQPHIANRIRLLELPAEVLESISRGILTVAHGKMLLTIKRWPKFLKAIVDEVITQDLKAGALEDLINREIRWSRGKWSKALFSTYPSEESPVFDVASCDSCKDRVEASDYSDNKSPFCMRPECWGTKQSEAINLARKQEEERAQKALDRAKAKGKKVVKLKNLPEGGYFASYAPEMQYVDKGKCASCESWVTAQDTGGRIVEICLDPACAKKQKAAAVRAKAQETKAETQAKIERVGAQAQRSVTAVTGPQITPELRELVKTARQQWGALRNKDRNATYGDAKAELAINQESLLTLEAFFSYNKARHELCAGATTQPAQLGSTIVAIPDQTIWWKGSEQPSMYDRKHPILAVSVKDHGLIVANSNGEVIDAPPEIPVYYRIEARVSPGSKIINQMMAIHTPISIIVILGTDNCTMRKDLFARWVKLAAELPGIDLSATTEGLGVEPGPVPDEAARLTDEEVKRVGIERALGHIENRWIEKQIIEAINRGDDAAKAAKKAVGQGGSRGGLVSYDSYSNNTKGKGLAVRSKDGREFLVTWREVVDYVKGKMTEESTEPVPDEPICTGPIGKVWRDNKGREIFVSAFAGHQSYGTFYRSSSGGLHRVDYSNRMPMVGILAIAQENLDKWARDNGCEEVVGQ